MANKGNKKCGEIAARKCAEQVRESVKILCKKCMANLSFFDSDNSDLLITRDSAGTDTTYTGGGGGGSVGAAPSSGAGGSGIVIIRYSV